ncbi:MAG: pyridoxamine 5'-phosphate oxidase family protein [Arenicella sp.]|nr:pyridoxamine 5'-phosphate oxidase family protein [Arenicella sp.]
MPTADEFYSQSQRKIQKEHDSHNLADAVVAAIVSDELQDEQIEFISKLDYFFLSTVNRNGEPTVSYKGGPVGLVNVVSPRKLVFPNYDGNGMFLSMGNATETGKIGMLFIDMETPLRVRVQGTAKVSENPELLALFPGSNMVVEVAVTAVFYNCARYIHKHQRIENSRYVPNEKGEQPFPAWKRINLLQEVLQPKDIGRAEQEGGTISIEEYDQKVQEGTS